MSSYRLHRMGRQLAELIDRGFELAQDLQSHAARTESAKAKADLAIAFTAVSDEVRHAICLEVRLMREAREAGYGRPRIRPHAGREAPKGEAVPADPAAPKIVKH